VDGEKQTLIAWDMTQSGLYDNFTGDRPSVCVGQTIFGLTSTKSDGSCEIHDINFIANVDEYISEATRIASVYTPAANGTVYTLQGIRSRNPQKGVFIQNGRKYIRE